MDVPKYIEFISYGWTQFAVNNAVMVYFKYGSFHTCVSNYGVNV